MRINSKRRCREDNDAGNGTSPTEAFAMSRIEPRGGGNGSDHGSVLVRFPRQPAALRHQERKGHPGDEGKTELDRALHAYIATFTGGFSPIGIAQAWFDWAAHLAISPGRQIELAKLAAAQWLRLNDLAVQSATTRGRCEPCGHSLPQDQRFRSDAWSRAPYALFAEAHLLAERWWDEAVDVSGTESSHRAMLAFISRQMLDVVAPSNFPATNPDVQRRIIETGGMCLVQGAINAAQDFSRRLAGKPPRSAEPFRPGERVALTEGEVILRTRLCEVIQYAPRTGKVRPEPVVIVPAWIMKYYILDLSPDNSLVRHLVEQGFTVFVVSWKNPTEDDRDIGFDDYRRLGVLPALDAALAITGGAKAHLVGYCLGGTLVAIAAAAMAREDDTRLATLTFLAAQTDFHEAGELQLFLNESQLSLLEDLMWQRGVLAGSQMEGTFHLLRSNDLVWSRMIRQYMMGEEAPSQDILAWAADSTRMPYRMHSEYLRSLHLRNDLAEGKFRVGNRPVAVQDIRAPVFAVGTEWDHVAPWRSVYRFHMLADTEVTFVLTNGGHNKGIVSEPGRADRHYRIATQSVHARHVDAEDWIRTVPIHQGSWWPAWFEWLHRHSGPMVAAPPMGRKERGLRPIEPAPGRFVFG